MSVFGQKQTLVKTRDYDLNWPYVEVREISGIVIGYELRHSDRHPGYRENKIQSDVVCSLHGQ